MLMTAGAHFSLCALCNFCYGCVSESEKCELTFCASCKRFLSQRTNIYLCFKLRRYKMCCLYLIYVRVRERHKKGEKGFGFVYSILFSLMPVIITVILLEP